MAHIPGQKDPLFEAVKGVIVGETPEGEYARSALGFNPLDESVRATKIPADDRERSMEALSVRTGTAGPSGFFYGQRAVYGGDKYRIESVREDTPAYGSPRVVLTLVDDEFSVRLRGVNANEVTVPTITTAMSEDVESLEEAQRVQAAQKVAAKLRKVSTMFHHMSRDSDIIETWLTSDHFKKAITRRQAGSVLQLGNALDKVEAIYKMFKQTAKITGQGPDY